MSRFGVAGLVVFGVLVVAALANAAFNKSYVPPAPSLPAIGQVGQLPYLQDADQAARPAQPADDRPARPQDAEQRVVRLGYRNYAFYFPESGSDTISLTAGRPVRIEGILDGPDRLVGCMKSIRTPWGLKVFTPGDNAFEFTPDRAGTVPFTCGMGMGTGVFQITN